MARKLLTLEEKRERKNAYTKKWREANKERWKETLERHWRNKLAKDENRGA